MTVIPVYKICPKCHKRYLWNPDTGRMGCPYCSGTGKTGKTGETIVGALLKVMLGIEKDRRI